MSAPTRAPYYWDHGTSEEGYPPGEAAGWLVDDMAWDARYSPDWKWGAVEIDLSLVAHDKGKRSVISFSGGGVSGTVSFVPDPSGWVLVTAAIGGTEVFRGYMDRPWEMYEIWAPGATPGKDDEGPGHMGKKLAWVGLNPDFWPALLPLADAEGSVMFEVDDDRLRIRMDREEQLRGK